MKHETAESDGAGTPGHGAAQRGPHGDQPLSFTDQPKAELARETNDRQTLWARGNQAADSTKKSTGNTSRKAKAGALATKIYYDDVYYSSRSGDENSFYELLRTKAQVDLCDISSDLDKGEVQLTLAKVNAKATLAHGQVDLVEYIGDMLFPPAPKPVPPPFTPPAPSAARVGDPTCHGSPLGPGSASPDVMIGGLPAWRASIDVHLCAMAGHGSGGAWSGATSVLINGSPAARAGDYVLEPGGGANVILAGERTVLIGARAPAPPAPVVSLLPEELPWVKLEAILQEDLGTAAFESGAAVDYSFEQRKAGGVLQAGGALALAEIALPLRVRIRIPGSASYLGLGATPQLTALGLGAQARAGAKLDPSKRGFELSAGTKGSVGIGAGIKFSIDVSE